ncbi:MAG: adenylosuccinate synthetase [Lachnospiraceae bacterium]
MGAGPFTTSYQELFGDEAEELRAPRRRREASTARPPAVHSSGGLVLDAVATRYGCMAQGATECAMTNLDVLGYLDEIPVCTAYEIDGKLVRDFPSTPS